MNVRELTGKNLKRLRESAKMTQEELGKHLSGGKGKQNISALERGKRSITPEILEQLCDIFACPPEAFYKMNGHSDLVEEMLHEEIDKMNREEKAALYAHAVAINTKAGR